MSKPHCTDPLCAECASRRLDAQIETAVEQARSWDTMTPDQRIDRALAVMGMNRPTLAQRFGLLGDQAGAMSADIETVDDRVEELGTDAA